MLLLISVLFPTLILAQNSYETPFDKLKTLTELQDIIDTFDILKYNFTAFKNGEKDHELMTEFQYQGKGEVKRAQADKIFIETSIKTSTMKEAQSSQIKFWLDYDKIVKLIHNKQEIPAAMANSMKDKWLQSIFFPFYHFKELNIKEIASAGKVTRSQEMIGEKEVDIIEIETNNLAEYGLKSANIKLANFERFMMTVRFDYITLEEAEAEFEEGQFEITEIELR